VLIWNRILMLQRHDCPVKDMDIACSVTLLFCFYVAYHLKGLTYRMLLVC